ncbi:hypothetical protein BDZ89DRAFT_1127092 [Hymenopellis radicata]|nr:hypothetical protein BDZ89DRAFT_1127092 [Hymenopellis radicata]
MLVADPQALIAIIAGRLKPGTVPSLNSRRWRPPKAKFLVGGIVLLADGDWVAFDRHKMPLVPFVFNADLSEEVQRQNHGGRSFYAGWLHLLGKITRSRRYKPVDVLLRDSGHFEDIHVKNYLTPINWNGHNIENGDKIGAIMNQNMREFFCNARAAALKNGVTARMLDIWEEEYLKEFQQCLYNIWHYSNGRKVQ